MKKTIFFLINFLFILHQNVPASENNLPAVICEHSWSAVTKELWNAIKAADIQRIEKIIDSAQINSIDSCGQTLLVESLHHSFSNDSLKIAFMLLSRGVDIDFKDYLFGYTALMHAALDENKQLIKLFLYYNADPDLYNNLGETARRMNSYLIDKAILANREEAIITQKEQWLLFSKLASSFHGKSIGSANGPVVHAIIKLDFGPAAQQLTSKELKMRPQFRKLK